MHLRCELWRRPVCHDGCAFCGACPGQHAGRQEATPLHHLASLRVGPFTLRPRPTLPLPSGVKLEREHSRPRRNMHPVLKQGNAQFRALQRQRAQQGQAGATEQGAAQQGGEQQRRRVGRQQGRGQAAAEGSN